MSEPQDRPERPVPGHTRPAAARDVPGRRPLPPHLDPRAPRRPHGSRRTTVSGASGSTGRRNRVARVLSWLAVLTSFSVLVLAVGGYALVHKYDGQIGRIPGALPTGGDRPEATSRDARNILIVGSDTRGDLAAGEGTQGTGDEFVTGQRSDTMLLAHLYGDSDRAEVVSLPRDSWVTIPEFTEPATGDVVEEHQAKLNSAMERGGPALLIRTIEDLSGLRVDNYMQIDFDGFLSLVNALDGVEVCLSQPAKERRSGIDLEAGRQTIKGPQALAFVRQRYELPRGDLDRIARQQQFIGAIVRKTLSKDTLLNPFRLNDVLNVATEAVQVDQGTSVGDLRDLATRLRTFTAGGVAFATLPVADPNARRNGQWIVELDDAGTAQLFGRIRNNVPVGTAQAAPEPAAPGLIVAPDAVRVQVYNGAGVTGLGRQAYDDLAAIGFRMAGTPGNRGSDVTVTTVYHGPDKADSARTLAAAVRGARTELDPSLDRTLDIVIGSSYKGATPVQATSATAGPPDATPTSPVPAVKTAAQDPCTV